MMRSLDEPGEKRREVIRHMMDMGLARAARFPVELRGIVIFRRHHQNRCHA